METLNSAARAAGFAMAPAEDELPSSPVPQEEANPWRPSQAVTLKRLPAPAFARPSPSMSVWVKGVFGMFGRGAPA
jgi:hypothetical protein